jgi:hypothetical protein
MSTLNFPRNPTVGQIFSLGGKTYRWSGFAWQSTSQGPVVASTLTASAISVGTGSNQVLIQSGNITIGGNAILTTASLGITTLQFVTDNGSTTTNAIKITNQTQSVDTMTGALVVTGGVGIGGDLNIEGTLYSEHVQIADSVFDSTSTQITTAVSTVIDYYPVTKFRTAKYLVQIDDNTTDSFQSSELLMLVANTGSNYSTWVNEYGTVKNNGALGQFQSQVIAVGGTPIAQLLFQANQATNKTIKVLRIGMTP